MPLTDDQPSEAPAAFISEDTSLEELELSPAVITAFREQLKTTYYESFQALKEALNSKDASPSVDGQETNLLAKFDQYFKAALELYKGDVASADHQPQHLADVQPLFDSLTDTKDSPLNPQEQWDMLPQHLNHFIENTNKIINTGIVTPLVRNLASFITSKPLGRSWLHTFIKDFSELQTVLGTKPTIKRTAEPLPEASKDEIEKEEEEVAQLREKVKELTHLQEEFKAALETDQAVIAQAIKKIQELTEEKRKAIPIPHYPAAVNFRSRTGITPILTDDEDDIAQLTAISAQHSTKKRSRTKHH